MKLVNLYNIFFFIGVNYCIARWSKYLSIKRIIMSNSSEIVDNGKMQPVISSRNKNSYCQSQIQLFIENSDFFTNKKLITISPGGFKGFYLLGILTYLKENYNTYDCIYSGASAGAWNALFMCYKGNPSSFVYKLLDESILNAKSVSEVQIKLKHRLLKICKDDDFELNKLFIGVTTFRFFRPKVNIYSDFENLEDAINCCIASSHIPFVTGGMTNKYKNLFSFDGGFSSYPYLSRERVLHVSHVMWKEVELVKQNIVKRAINSISKYAEFFSVSKNNFIQLFENGFIDAKYNSAFFDKIFEPRNEHIFEF